ncbi:hypothetical protein [Vibrio genomosp. F10]|nr:hypothetical protein [Vibrio genomosp. F10]
MQTVLAVVMLGIAMAASFIIRRMLEAAKTAEETIELEQANR